MDDRYKIRIARGNKAALLKLEWVEGEFLFTLDTNELYMGLADNKLAYFGKAEVLDITDILAEVRNK